MSQKRSLRDILETTERHAEFLREQENILQTAKEFLENQKRESQKISGRIDANLEYCKHLLEENDYYTQPGSREMILIGKIRGKDTHVARNTKRIPPANAPTDVLYLEALLQLPNLNLFEFTHHPNIVTESGEPVWMPCSSSNHCNDMIERFLQDDQDVSNINYRKLVKHLSDCSCGIQFGNQKVMFDSKN
jgi:hypothetical protein